MGAYVPRLDPHEHCGAWEDAGVEVAYAWHGFATAATALTQASALVALSNAMSDLVSWLPGFDGDTGTMPWERGEDEATPSADQDAPGGDS